MPISPVPWTLLASPDFANPLELNDVKQAAPWILACRSWRDISHLQIEASGEWGEAGAPPNFGPDGAADVSLPAEQLDVRDCPAGALIGKLGGSSATLGLIADPKPAADGRLSEGMAFAIGSFCVVALPDDCRGPLYVRFNGLKQGVEIKNLKVTIKGAPETKV